MFNELSAFYMIFFFFFFFFLSYTDGKVLRGHIITRENWAFLARFCFLTEQSIFRYEFELGGLENELHLLLYYDAPHQWASVYPTNKSCKEKESVLNIRAGQLVKLTIEDEKHSGCEEVNNITRCTSQRSFLSARPRWWFIAVSDCSSTTGLNFSYWISLTNASPDNFWKHHFSADQFCILPELIATACVYVILVGFSFYVALQLRARRLFHVSYKLFMSSLLCQLFGVLFEMYSYINLGFRGELIENASLMGQLLQACSDILYTVLMLLLALGFTVTKNVLTRTQTQWLLCFVALITICQFSLYICQSEIFDPGLVLYIYESPPGYGLIGLKLIAWIIFTIRCFKTAKKMTIKLNFYASLISLGSAWFLCHPLTVLCITLLVDEWVRESVAKGCSLWIIFMGHVTFLYITRPAVANTRFPFHIRTCQVVPIGGEGQDHSYMPQTRTTTSTFTISHLSPPVVQARQ